MERKTTQSLYIKNFCRKLIRKIPPINDCIVLIAAACFVIMAYLSFQGLNTRRICVDTEDLFLEAIALADNGEYDKALKRLNQCIQICPGFAQAYFYRARVYDATHRYLFALTDYTRAIEINHRYYEAYNNRGVTYRTIGNLDAAIKDYSLSLQIFPRYCQALKNRSIAYRRNKMFDEALKDLNIVIGIYPKDDDTILLMGKTKFEGGKLLDAISDFNKVIELSPDNTQARGHRGDISLKLGFFEQAVVDYEKAMQDHTSREKFKHKRQVAYEKMEHLGPAKNRMISSGNQQPWGLKRKSNLTTIINNQTGLKLISQGNFSEAIKEFAKAIETDEMDFKAFFYRGFTQRKLGKEYDAILDFSHAIQINPNYLPAYKNRGSLCFKHHLYDQAKSDAANVLRINPKDKGAHYQLALCYRQSGNLVESLKFFDKALFLAPKAYKIYNDRGMVFHALKQFEYALIDFDRVISLKPDFTPAYTSRGTVKTELGKYNDAIKDFTTAVGIDPNDAIAYLSRGTVYMTYFKDAENACADWKKACALGQCRNYNIAKAKGLCN